VIIVYQFDSCEDFTMYFALVSASSTDNVDPGVSDKDSSKGAERGQRNSSNSSINKHRDRLSTEVCCNLKTYHPNVYLNFKGLVSMSKTRCL
jgi:hypothetical protein